MMIAWRPDSDVSVQFENLRGYDTSIMNRDFVHHAHVFHSI